MTKRDILLEQLEKLLPAEIPGLGFNKGQLCKLLTREARLYAKKLKKADRPYIGLGTACILLSGFINEVGLHQGLDVGLDAKDLLIRKCPYAENVGD